MGLFLLNNLTDLIMSSLDCRGAIGLIQNKFLHFIFYKKSKTTSSDLVSLFPNF